MKHYIKSENCEKRNQKYYVYLKRKSVLVHLELIVKEIKGMLMNFKVVVDERKNSISRIWT